jgi:hypothetical protein
VTEDDVRAALDRIGARLDHIEDYLSDLSGTGVGRLYVRMGDAERNPTAPGALPAEVGELLAAGNRREAIVRFRELTGANAEQAIAAIDAG